MSEALTLLQFQSPWQGRTGFARHCLNRATGELSAARNAKAAKLFRKGQKGIEGLVLFPTWPTQNGLIVTASGTGLRLSAVKRGRVAQEFESIETSDPDFRMEVSERLLYRTFTFSNATTTIRFSDLSARLMSPERTAYEVFPTPDFSPFARLISIIGQTEAQKKLVSDLKRGRFDYPCWSKSAPRSHRTGAGTLAKA